MNIMVIVIMGVDVIVNVEKNAVGNVPQITHIVQIPNITLTTLTTHKTHKTPTIIHITPKIKN